MTDPIEDHPDEGEPAANCSEVQLLRQKLAQDQRLREEQERRFAAQLKQAEAQIKGHLSYRLGREIVRSGASPLAWASLPFRLVRAYRAFLKARSGVDHDVYRRTARKLRRRYQKEGVAGLRDRFEEEFPGDQVKVAQALIRAGSALYEGGLQEARPLLTREALELHRSPEILRAHFWACHKAADFKGAWEASEELQEIAQAQDLPLEERARLESVFRHPVRQLSILKLARPREEAAQESVPGRLCYVLHNSLPYSSGGYATRAQGLAQALADTGWEVVALTRPGFPCDVAEVEPEAVLSTDVIEGIPYVRELWPSRRGQTTTSYIEGAADALERQLRSLRPSVVVAASNHLTGLPALIAARRLGIPFFYEVRGLWEVTRLSREPAFAETVNYWLQRHLEAAVALEAEGVFTLTGALRDELVAREVPAEKIRLLPNACDPERFEPLPRDRALQAELGFPEGVPVIGYIGTFVSYEGLEDLAAACGRLKAQGLAFRLLLVGNEDASGSGRGEITEAIQRAAVKHGFQDWLAMPGRVPHEVVPAYYSLIDIAPFPRKPLPVCEMVSPMKPLEALAMEKAVVVSDVRALAEMVRDGETGLLFRKGDVDDLTDKLVQLVKDSALRRSLGRNGRQWVQEERTWRIVADKMSNVIRGTLESRAHLDVNNSPDQLPR